MLQERHEAVEVGRRRRRPKAGALQQTQHVVAAVKDHQAQGLQRGHLCPGQPRDENPKAAYVVYDLDESTIELRRLDYDIAKAQKKIIDAGLPQRLADRLSFGK